MTRRALQQPPVQNSRADDATGTHVKVSASAEHSQARSLLAHQLRAAAAAAQAQLEATQSIEVAFEDSEEPVTTQWVASTKVR